MSVDCTSKVEADPQMQKLLVGEIRDWVSGLPDRAVLHAISRDFGTQRDPEVHLVGLRASWSERR